MKTFAFCDVFVIACFHFLLFSTVEGTRSEKLARQVQGLPLLSSNRSAFEKVRAKLSKKGCPVNLCFALDGSASLENNFSLQKQFVQIITAAIGGDNEAQFAGTVYGLTNENIRKLSNNPSRFIGDVGSAEFPKAPATFLSVGLGFCFTQLVGAKVSKDSNKIVVLQDSLSNFADSAISPLRFDVPQQWRNLNPRNEILFVAVGFAKTFMQAGITGDKKLVLKATDWQSLMPLLEQLVNKVCFTPPRPLSPSPSPTPRSVPCPCKCLRGKKGKRGLTKARNKAKKQCDKRAACEVKSCRLRGFQCCRKD